MMIIPPIKMVKLGMVKMTFYDIVLPTLVDINPEFIFRNRSKVSEAG
jgi:hypothetical protein